jgi:hypothetical protein
VNNPKNGVAALREENARLREAVVVEPCHTTGDHDPTHTARYVCTLQLAEIAKRVMVVLGLTKETLPRRLHNPAKCYWCSPERKDYTELQAWSNADAEKRGASDE